MAKIRLKRSQILETDPAAGEVGRAKRPTSGQTEYGELCVNYNADDPSLFIRDSNDNIVKVGGNVEINTDGDIENIKLDLSYSRDATTNTVVNPAGNNSVFQLATQSLAGLMDPVDKIIVDGIQINGDGNILNAIVNLGYTPSPTNGLVTNSAGTDSTLPLVDDTNAGLMSPGDKVRLDGIEDGV